MQRGGLDCNAGGLCHLACRAMFCSGLRESHEEQVEIKGLDRGTMRCLLDYTYTSQALITSSNVQRILEAASQFQVRDRGVTFIAANERLERSKHHTFMTGKPDLGVQTVSKCFSMCCFNT